MASINESFGTLIMVQVKDCMQSVQKLYQVTDFVLLEFITHLSEILHSTQV